jgi:hypothetical protein
MERWYYGSMVRPDMVPGSVAQEFASLLFEARLCLRAFCCEHMAVSQPEGKKNLWMAAPPQVTPHVKHDKEFFATDERAAAAAECIIKNVNEVTGAIRGFIAFFGDKGNLASQEASRLCAFMSEFRHKTDRHLEEMHRGLAALHMMKQSAWDDIELRYDCPPLPCCTFEESGFLSGRAAAQDRGADPEVRAEPESGPAPRPAEERDIRAREHPPEPEGTRRRRRGEGNPE